MSLKKGTRVRHPTRGDWGLGEVLEDSIGRTARVFFVGCGEKSISLDHVRLEIVPRAEARDPLLDNLHAVSAPGVRYQSLAKSKDRFLELYPAGFYGERYLKKEREYKVRAHQRAKTLLDRDELDSLLSSKRFGDVCRRSLQVSNATNLIFPNEKMALKGGLTSETEESFGRALSGLLHGEVDHRVHFEAFARVLEEIGAAKWTIATYFQFFFDPERFLFLKPKVTREAAEICAFEISYRPQLNWITYSRVLDFAEYLKAELADLKPRDMIDVQSFLWSVGTRRGAPRAQADA